jgi:1,2-phenylacetyl-CoA epoxidase catalytic subunit
VRGDKLAPMIEEPLDEPINADPTYAPLIEAERAAEADAAEDNKGRGVLRFYELAKKQEWQVRDLPWGAIPPIPETRAGASRERKERRRAVWRSVITQQLQADEFAVEMAAQLLNMAPHREAKLYYSTMAQDEARHVEAWLKLANEAGGVAERDPHLDELAKITLHAETLEEKVFQMQVFFERLIIPRFRLIARTSRGTVLEDLCNRLTIDDGIHHSSGVAYERVLLQDASKQTKDRLVKAANRLLPTFVDHALWRPKERAWIGTVMRETDIRRLQDDIRDGIRMASSLGLDVSDVEIPFAA